MHSIIDIIIINYDNGMVSFNSRELLLSSTSQEFYQYMISMFSNTIPLKHQLSGVTVTVTPSQELGLPATYRQYEESTVSLIRMHIQQISAGLNHKVCQYASEFLLSKSCRSECGIYCSILKWLHLITRISIIDTSIYLFINFCWTNRKYGMYCFMLKWRHLITHIE